MLTLTKIASRFGLALAVVSSAILAAAAMASATPYTVPADPTGGAGDATLSGVANWIITYGGPLVAGLLLIGIIFGVLVKFARRGARSA